MSGVEIAATMAANLIETREIRPLEGGRAVLVLWGIFLGLALYLLPSVRALPLLAVGLGIGYLGIAHYLFVRSALWIPMVIPLVQLLVLLVETMRLKYWMIEEEKEALKNEMAELEAAIVRIMPADSAKELIVGIQDAIKAGRFIPASACLHTDAIGYSTVAASLDAESLALLMEEYYQVISAPAKRRGAVVHPTLETGDSLMMTWPFPEATLEVRQQLCETALEIVEGVEAFNRTHPATPLRTRVGIHIGEDVKLEWKGLFFQPHGNVVIVTQRIEACNKIFKTNILSSQEVVDGLGMFLHRGIGRFRFTGMGEPHSLCELACRMETADAIRKESVTAWAGALAVYRSRRWDEAMTFFEEFEKAYGKDGLCRFYIERCRLYTTNPPPESWDGVVQINK